MHHTCHNAAKSKNRHHTLNFHIFTLQDKLRHVLKLSIWFEINSHESIICFPIFFSPWVNKKFWVGVSNRVGRVTGNKHNFFLALAFFKMFIKQVNYKHFSYLQNYIPFTRVKNVGSSCENRSWAKRYWCNTPSNKNIDLEDGNPVVNYNGDARFINFIGKTIERNTLSSYPTHIVFIRVLLVFDAVFPKNFLNQW